METFKYRELHQLLKSQIIEGMYKEGDLLPSENELSSSHDMTRSTVRQALQKMEKEGYIIKRKGKGSIVNLKKRRLGLLSFKGFSEVISHTDEKVNNHILEGPVLQSWPDDFFYALSDAELEAECVFLHRLRLIDLAPIMLEYTYIPNLDLPRFTDKKLTNDSLFATLALNYDIEIVSMDQEVRAIKADKELASYLETEAGEPILHAYRKYGTSRRDLFIYSSLFFNTDSFAIGSYFK
ncbi:GntR family transcriptional regulator [Pararhodonellum marinum]|uniref:GntR family transcriptional regulator n=1 Tax=Pararhodonellum marinum TaxID=2755358 RepID=UPI00189056F6|nr:GntR family transcriptional regulator [Pararhodonellum marinum]